MAKVTEIEKLKTEFLEYVEIEKGRSLKTVENYDRYLSRFLDHTGIKKPKDITDEVVRKFRLWLNRQTVPTENGKDMGTLKKKTQNYYLIALRSFLKYMMVRGVTSLTPDRIELAKVGERSLDLITADELARILDAPKGDELKILRDKAILETLFSTGLRVSELCALPREIDLGADEMSVRGKGEKVRVVFMSERARSSLTKYLSARKDMDDALFIQIGNRKRENGSQRLTPRSVERIIQVYALRAGVSKKVTPHVIRHSFATDLLSNGADLRSVQALLGHAHIATTQVYTHVTDPHLKKIHKDFHDKGRK